MDGFYYVALTGMCRLPGTEPPFQPGSVPWATAVARAG